ncbi:MAG TPA: hypothetical protein VMM59_08020, partial [Thermohalobaculum sp.]|nr:hypothetical protein [Thermohalobaculum sp.]
QKPEPEAVAEAQPDAPVAAAPQQARLPVAKPAELAAAARASSAPEPLAAAPKPQAEKPEKPRPVEQAAPQEPAEPKPAGPAPGSTSQFAATITRGEKDALRLGIKQFFVYNGNRADRSLQVTIAVELGPDARIVGGPELLRASGGDEGAREALWQAGRRALMKAESAGEFTRLPPDKHAGWRLIHVTFTPEEIGFSS